VTSSDAIAALHGRIARYYTGRVERFGATPAGVDWPNERNQQLRFAQLLRVCDFGTAFSLNDLGCGYGALLGYLQRVHPHSNVQYTGFDVSHAMVAHAQDAWRNCTGAAFEVGSITRPADYSVASGIFNVRLDEPLRLWERFVADTLRTMAAGSRRGFAVNFLNPLPKAMDTVPELYRPALARWPAFCKDELGATVKVVAGYGLREVTLLVRTGCASVHR
jgi:SAM-dependent methyltransferase